MDSQVNGTGLFLVAVYLWRNREGCGKPNMLGQRFSLIDDFRRFRSLAIALRFSVQTGNPVENSPEFGFFRHVPRGTLWNWPLKAKPSFHVEHVFLCSKFPRVPIFVSIQAGELDSGKTRSMRP